MHFVYNAKMYIYSILIICTLHLAENYTAPGTSMTYRMAGDVGLLSRNIKIIGGDYPNLYTESYGARVLVGSFSAGGIDYRGIQLERASRDQKREHQNIFAWTTDLRKCTKSLFYTHIFMLLQERPRLGMWSFTTLVRRVGQTAQILATLWLFSTWEWWEPQNSISPDSVQINLISVVCHLWEESSMSVCLFACFIKKKERQVRE